MNWTVGTPSNITATTTFSNAKGLLGIFVSSASATPTITITDDTTTIVNTFTPAAATWYHIPVTISNSLVVTISGSVNCCVVWS